VIGQNGLALIHGPNHLATLEARFKTPTILRNGSTANAHCQADWATIGLRAVFNTRTCNPDSILIAADASRTPWSSLGGIHVGDPIGEMLWQDPNAKPINTSKTLRGSRSYWQLAHGGATGHAQLVAVSTDGQTITLLSTDTGA
jgi:hypothetical protein